MLNKYQFLEKGSAVYKDIVKKEIDFVNKEQLLNKKLWKKFVNVFRENADSNDEYWRCEYWGKMMRGACLCYQYENSKDLYDVLEAAVLDLISTQDDEGRITTYTKEKEFNGWDVWGRKYVLSGLLHFYEICHKDGIKNTVLVAATKHANYIINKLGNKRGQKEITKSSKWWGGVNSCSIIEPMMNLYLVTNDVKYLEFAGYIVKTGGIDEGNLIDVVQEGKLLPHQYPEVKAYETMSFFEGVLEYALVTKNKRLEDIAIKFFNDVHDSEVSITGNAGADNEYFNNGVIMQTVKPEHFCQETCVTVTWMRVTTKLLMITGDAKYYDWFEVAAHNSFYSSLNFYHQSAVDWWKDKKKIKYLPFDSYSPLKNDVRGKSTGGLCYMSDGSYYGCCACIGSAGVGLTALNAVMLNGNKELIINDYYTGKVSTNDVEVKIINNINTLGIVDIKVKAESAQNMMIRIPTWSNKPTLTMNGKDITINECGYLKVEIKKGINNIVLTLNPKIKKVEINNNIAYVYGPITLAVDELSNKDIVLEDLRSTSIKDFNTFKNCGPTQLIIKAKYNDQDIYFKDYASAGKKWDCKRPRMTVWIDK